MSKTSMWTTVTDIVSGCGCTWSSCLTYPGDLKHLSWCHQTHGWPKGPFLLFQTLTPLMSEQQELLNSHRPLIIFRAHSSTWCPTQAHGKWKQYCWQTDKEMDPWATRCCCLGNITSTEGHVYYWRNQAHRELQYNLLCSLREMYTNAHWLFNTTLSALNDG